VARLAQAFVVVVVDDRGAGVERGARRGDDLLERAWYVRVRLLAGRAVDRRFDDQGLHGFLSTASSSLATPRHVKTEPALFPVGRPVVTTLTASRSRP
jgi:hypothetical protein